VNPTATARVLLFRLERREYAIFLSHVSGLLDASRISKVTGAPGSVLGLTPWRGRLLTILDLPTLVGDAPTDDRPSLVRLTGPFTNTALFVPAALTMENLAVDEMRPCQTPGLPVEGILTVGSETILVLDPAVLIERLENEIIGVSASSQNDGGEILPFAKEG